MRWRGGIQARAVRKLPFWIRTAPLDGVFAVGITPFALLALIGATRSRALSELIPDWSYRMWAGVLLIGCVHWIIGLSSIREVNSQTVITRMPALLFGLSLVPGCTGLFAVAVLMFGGLAGLSAAVFPLLMTFGIYIRKVDLSTRYRRTIE